MTDVLSYVVRLMIWLVGQGIGWTIYGVRYGLWAIGLDLSKGKHLWTIIVVGLILFTRPDAGFFLRITGYVTGQLALWWGQHPIITTVLVASAVLVLLQEQIVAWGASLQAQEAPETPDDVAA